MACFAITIDVRRDHSTATAFLSAFPRAPTTHFGPPARSATPTGDTTSAEFTVPLPTLARGPATICASAEFFDPTAPKGTGLLTLSGRLGRDSEISRPRFWGAEGTLAVPFGPYLFSVETEMAGRRAKSTQTLARTGHKRETFGGRNLGSGR